MKRVVITGGSGGLGSEVVSCFAAAGWQVTAPDRAELDLADPAAIENWFAGREVDLLVCAAGILRDAPIARLGDAAWDETMAINFHAASRCAHAARSGMVRRGRGGHIVFISSRSALVPPVGQAAYAAAKAALLGLTRDLARAHGAHGIRVNAILPGFLETPMTAGISPARKGEILAEHHLGRFNTPRAVAVFIHFLHEHLPHTSGQIFQLDSRT